MKQTLFISVCIIAVACMFRCSKNNNTPAKNLATCTSCNKITLQETPDSTGRWYFLPTAFTPNGDGVNDDFRLFYNNKFNVDSSTITIWDINGNGVYEGTINEVWNGKDLKGNLCAAGHYPLYLKLRTTSGLQINQCGCVSILTYKGNCIYTAGVKYYMADQLDTATGFTYATYDHLCQ